MLIPALMLMVFATVSARTQPESGSPDGLDIYLIRLSDAPLASYRGDITGLEATNPGVLGERKLNVASSASQAYATFLEGKRAALINQMDQVFGRSVDVVYEYYVTNNGMAVRLTAAEAAIVAEMPDVVVVRRDYERQLMTDAGPAWIGAPEIWNGTATGGMPGTKGEGIIVGVIDTGINPSNPSFADIGGDAYDHDNPFGSGTYVGVCDSGDPSFDPTFPCNDKLIGAWGFPTVNGGDPRDNDGHGSHTASTSAGNVVTATVVGPTLTVTRTITGVAPHANIIAYAACCTASALASAIDQVVLDGVDVVNYSIGSDAPTSPWDPGDFDSSGFLAARDAGVFVATSAGNNGPGAATVGSPAVAPWILSVGASTHDRAYPNAVTDMSGGGTPPADMFGKGFTDGYGPADIVFAGDFPADVGTTPELCGAGAAQSNTSPWNPGTFSGQIVVCERGIYGRVEKGENVLAAGAGGYILVNTAAQGESINGDAHALPGVHLGATLGDQLLTWLASGSGHTAVIAGAVLDIDPANGDIMAGFSSRGPNVPAPSIIVPSLSAPGVDIIAADGVGDAVSWGFNSGTSMASPHAAGAAALLMALHPTWTPAEIQSAMMLSADPSAMLKDDGSTPADPFDDGSGRVDLTHAGIIGLVMDESTANYTAANPDTGGDPSTLNLASLGQGACQDTCSWNRTVTNRSGNTWTWNASVIDLSGGVTGDVSPTSFSLADGASQTITVTLDVTGATLNTWHFGQLELAPTVVEGDPAPPNSYMPIAAFAIDALPPALDLSATSLSATVAPDQTTNVDLTIGNTGEQSLEWSLFEYGPITAVEGGWSDNFDSYATGSQLHGQGGWKGWANDPSAGALTSSAQAVSTPNSVEIVGASDLVQEYTIDDGTWTFSGMQYIPASLSGVTYFIMLNQYDDAGATNNWSIEVQFDGTQDMVIANGNGTGDPLPIIYDQWVEIRVEIDLVNDMQFFFYGGDLLYFGSWSENVSGGGITSIGALDLFANNASAVYYDDLSLQPSSGFCASPADIPWLSLSDTSGTVAGGGSDTVTVTMDATGLSSGSYSGFLCLETNDPAAPLVPIPVEMLVGYLNYLPIVIKG
ncbi:MAG: S8 family serine peptidase [Anaerolineales bacterium]|nr:S8 family serine peptidase [Anaerolineales bacterium]MCB8962994.1 S8 family serine peptidase [Ardenticatenales bacterium]